MPVASTGPVPPSILDVWLDKHKLLLKAYSQSITDSITGALDSRAFSSNN